MKDQTTIDASNQYGSYRKGWIAGARTTAMDPVFTHHENSLIRDAYNLGYHDGQLARDDASRFAAEKYNHTVNFLRLAERPHEPTD